VTDSRSSIAALSDQLADAVAAAGASAARARPAVSVPSGPFLGDAAARLRASVVAIVDEAHGSGRGRRASRGGHGAGFAWGDGDLFVTSAVPVE